MGGSESDYNFARTSSKERCYKTLSEQLRNPRSCHPQKGLVVVGGKYTPREQPPYLTLRAPALRSPISVIKAVATKQSFVGAVNPTLRPRGGGDEGNRRAQARGVDSTLRPDHPDRRLSWRCAESKRGLRRCQF